TLRWRHGGADLSLTQTGDYPLADTMTFAVEASTPTKLALRFRVPAWAQRPSIRVNGAQVAGVIPASFATIERVWSSGDRIEVTLPKRLELKAIDAEHPDLVALVNGPMVLFAIGYDLPKFDRSALLAARQTTAGAAEWRAGNIRFLPW